MTRLKQLLVAGILVISPGVTAVSAKADVMVQATEANRAMYRQQQERQIRPEHYDLNLRPVNNANESFWRNLLWTTAIVEPQAPYVAEAIEQLMSLATRSNLTTAQQRTIDMAMQVGTQLYLGHPTVYSRLEPTLVQTIEHSPDPMWVAMAFSALVQRGLDPASQQQWATAIQQRFPNWTHNVYLYATLREVAEYSQTPPPLSDLLEWTIAPHQPHLYVLCRPDRGVLCQAILKDRHGRFLTDNGQLWSVPLSLRSIHDLSWVFSRGQTPQGIYRIQGAIPQPDTEFFRAFGQFSLVNLFVPFEAGVQEFVVGRSGSWVGLSDYQALLPPAWRNYFPIQQIYWAGKAGRALFRIHGTGEATTFFSNNQRYPTSQNWNPTIGCLSALELYDESGRLLAADMPKILEALRTAGEQNFTGYLIVVDVPGDEPIQTELETLNLANLTPQPSQSPVRPSP
ncbi:hypothetical protein [Thermocoleostomius sinensis]|uniref:DUF3131 domain-containing protein n=1 Tax=Thermocoleostomius sinensis A174 TaxID=2016057 RepID=A0A9E8ZDQ1_9CYAN|nr:hypothetical protein [Thermocoleostomius sinensis]WAL61419.1 hypothetical protein OXH18_05360 [Thermocoleostomius sinensis A174]